jgi:Glutamate decarboxylase and related PLP-dependent proteins
MLRVLLQKDIIFLRADSVTWNPHKLLAVPQQCSVLLVQHADLLRACHSRNAAYLFQKDKFYDTSYDTGDKYLQCGRRADVFKFWFMWKAKVHSSLLSLSIASATIYTKLTKSFSSTVSGKKPYIYIN